MLLIGSFNVSEKLDIYTKRVCDAVSMSLSRQVGLRKEKYSVNCSDVTSETLCRNGNMGKKITLTKFKRGKYIERCFKMFAMRQY